MPIAQGPGGTPIDVVVKVTVKNLSDINNINKRVNAQVKQLESQWAKVGRKINVAKINVKAMDASVNSLGNHMGFVAFQWMFISGIAQRALMSIRQIGQQIMDKGAAGHAAMTRALVQTAKLGESLDKVALRERGIQNFIIAMSMETGKSMTEAADAVKDVGKALNDVNGVIPVTKEVMRLAVIEEINMSEAAKGFIGVMNNYKNSVDSVRQVSNTLIGVNLQSRISLNELIHAFEFSAATASDMGMTLEETGTILGMMGDRLTPGRIGRQFATLLEELRETSVATNPVLQKLGVHIYDAKGNFRGLPEILKSISHAMKEAGSQSDAMKTALLDTMKLDRVAKRALIGLIDSMDEYDESIGELTSEEMQAKIQETYEKLSNTPEANIEKLKGAVELLSMEFVGGLAPAISEIVAEVQKMIQISEVNDLIHTLGKEIGNTVVPVVRFLAAGLAEAAKAMLMVKKVLGPLANVIVGVVGAMIGLMIVSQLVMLFAVLAATIEKVSGASLGAMLTTKSLVRVLARLAAFAALLIVAFLGVKYAVIELRKGFDDMNVAIVAIGLAAAAAAMTIAFMINPLMGVAIAAIVLTPLILEAVKALMDMAGVQPDDDWGLAFLRILDFVTDGIKEWGADAVTVVGDYFAEMNTRGMKRFNEQWGWLGLEFEKIADQINPSLDDFNQWGRDAMHNIKEGLKEAFPVLAEFETWWNEKLDQWRITLGAAGKDLGEWFALNLVEGILTTLGPLGTMLKFLFQFDIKKAIAEAERQKIAQREAQMGAWGIYPWQTGQPNRFGNWTGAGDLDPDKQTPIGSVNAKDLSGKVFGDKWFGPTGESRPAGDVKVGGIPRDGDMLGGEPLSDNINVKGGIDNINKANTELNAAQQALADAAQRKLDAEQGLDVLTPGEIVRIEKEALEAKIAAEENLVSAEQELIDLFVYGKIHMIYLNEAQYALADEIMTRAVAEGQYSASLLEGQKQNYKSTMATEASLQQHEESLNLRKLTDEQTLIFNEAMIATNKATITSTAHTELMAGGITAYSAALNAALVAENKWITGMETNTGEVTNNSTLTGIASSLSNIHNVATDFNTQLIDLHSKVLEHSIRMGNASNRQVGGFVALQELFSHEVGRSAADQVFLQNALIRGTNAMNALATAASRTVERLASFKMSVGYTTGTKQNGSKYISSVWPIYSMAGFGGPIAGVDTNTPEVRNERDPGLITGIASMLKGIWGEEGPGGKSVTVNMNVERLDPATDIEALLEEIADKVENKDSLE